MTESSDLPGRVMAAAAGARASGLGEIETGTVGNAGMGTTEGNAIVGVAFSTAAGGIGKVMVADGPGISAATAGLVSSSELVPFAFPV